MPLFRSGHVGSLFLLPVVQPIGQTEKKKLGLWRIVKKKANDEILYTPIF
jgi:hypothetical protein